MNDRSVVDYLAGNDFFSELPGEYLRFLANHATGKRLQADETLFREDEPADNFYLLRSGCSWRMLPHDLPPWRLVWHYFAHWKKQGVWAALNDALRDAVRLKHGKKKPRLLRFSTRRVCAQLSKVDCAATMLARRWQDESDTFWSIPWD